jgi:dTDP-4-amino-4,6-dideoxygalactose transaminase
VAGTLDHATLPKVAGTFGGRGEVAATSNTRAKVAGTFGDFGCFSFFPSKNLGAWGDGGMVVTRDPDHGTRIAQLRAHGGLVPYVSNETGLNSRLDALHAAVLRVKLRHLSAWTAGRRAAAAYYREWFASFRLLDVVKPPLDAADEFHVYNQFTIRCIHRDALADHLKAEGIGVAVYYPLPLHLQPCFAGLGYKQGDFPRAERACQEVLSLPMHPFLCRDEQEYVVEKIASFYCGAR